jgi:hypothetical protein
LPALWGAGGAQLPLLWRRGAFAEAVRSDGSTRFLHDDRTEIGTNRSEAIRPISLRKN